MRFYSSRAARDRRRCRGQGRFACDNCDRRYHQVKNLRRHVMNECGKQPMHQCTFCPYRATYKSYLQVHMMKHARLGFTPRIANEARGVCGSKEPRSLREEPLTLERRLPGSLMMMRGSFVGNGPKCAIVSRESQYQATAMAFKHTCVTCGKTYKHKHHLKRHHDFECGIDPKFKCAFCPHRTRYKDSLMKHILARHQHLLEQNSQYGHQQIFDVHADVDSNLHVQGTMFASYHDFSQNL
ncbi:hypothetical protein KM043_007679 [Ampulex compressa]|nr:hypothetical protein KM043_007679 [Ampulex compressa]